MSHLSGTKILGREQLRQLYSQAYVESYHQDDVGGRLQHIVRQLPLDPRWSVVDYACGNGLLYAELRGKVTSYTGVDFSTEFIAAAQFRCGQEKESVEFVDQEITEFCRANPQRFELAFALDFVEHIYDHQLLEIFTAIRHSLKPGGMVVIHTPNAEFWLETCKNINLICRQFPEHIAVRNVDHLQHLLTLAGYSEIMVRYLPHYHPWLRKFEWFSHLPLLGRFFRARLLIFAK